MCDFNMYSVLNKMLSNKWIRKKQSCSGWNLGGKPQALVRGLCIAIHSCHWGIQRLQKACSKITYLIYLFANFLSHKESILITVKLNTLDLEPHHWAENTMISIQPTLTKSLHRALWKNKAEAWSLVSWIR